MQRLGGSWLIWLLGLATLTASVIIFFALAGDVWDQEAFWWDVPLMRTVRRLHTPWLDAFMITFTWLGGPGKILVAALTAYLLWRYRQRPAAIALVTALVGAFLFNNLLKIIFARPRPEVFEPLTVVTTYSFPSGHAMSSVAFYGFITYLLLQRRRWGWALLATAIALTISFSRIYLGVHYPSDVLAALAAGLLWLGPVILGYVYYKTL
jgi:undecaprenyl-diphosphatase